MKNKDKGNKPPLAQRSRRRKLSGDYYAGIEGELVPRICGSEGIKKLFKNLIRRFDQNDVVNVLLVELVTADYWRAGKALEFENYSTRGNPYQWGLADPHMMRYSNASRRNLHKSLEMLLKLDEATWQQEASYPQEEVTGPAHDLPSEPVDLPSDEQPALAESPKADEEEMPDRYWPRTDICDLKAGTDTDPIWDELPSDPSSVNSAQEPAEQPNHPAPQAAEGIVENGDCTSGTDSPKAA